MGDVPRKVLDGVARMNSGADAVEFSAGVVGEDELKSAARNLGWDLAEFKLAPAEPLAAETHESYGARRLNRKRKD